MASSRQINRVAIMGLGLMGGSLAMAIKRKRMAKVVVGYARRAKTRKQALANGIVDRVFAHPASAIQGADIVVFCTPVGVIPDLVQSCVAGFAEHAVVTDVGSSKAKIVAQVEPFFKHCTARFIGSHPIAGSERQGLEVAFPGLYENAMVIVTPSPRTARSALQKVTAFWKGLGARVGIMSPEGHDRLMARTSHLPHLAAALLASTVGRNDADRLSQFCGTGFLDTTRIADGSPDLWRDIVCSNRRAVVKELKAFHQQVDRLIQCIERGDFDALRRFLEASRMRRRKLVKGKT